jgi:hypothetical protein
MPRVRRASARLNSEYQAFAASVSQPFHDAIADIGRLAELDSKDQAACGSAHLDEMEQIRIQVLSTFRP